MAGELKELKADLKTLRQQMAAMRGVIDSLEMKISELEGIPTLTLIYKNSKPMLLKKLRDAAIKEFEISLEEFENPGGYKHFMIPRFLFCHAAAHQNIGFSEIGRFIGRDHSTVINSCKKALALMKQEPELFESYQRIIKAVNGKGEKAS